MPTKQEDVATRVKQMKDGFTTRVEYMRTWAYLTRGIDPRTQGDTSVFDAARFGDPAVVEENLRTSDPRSYFNLVVHMLSGNLIMWQLPLHTAMDDEEKRNHGKAEKLVEAIYRINDKRMLDRGKPRTTRSLADSASRFGMAVVFRRVIEMRGEKVWLIEPWDPRQVYEEMDDFGIAECVRQISVRKQDLINKGIVEGWNEDALRWVRDQQIKEHTVSEYWQREFVSSTKTEVWHSITIENFEDPLLPMTREANEPEIPVKIHKFGGEAFPNGKEEWAVQSILAPAAQTYLDEHDMLRKIELHGRRSLSQQISEHTHLALPRADAKKLLDPRGGPSITRYDSTRREGGMTLVPQNPLDPSIQIYEMRLNGMRQRVTVPDALYGSMDVTLSGFAIQQLLHGAAVAAQESQVVLQAVHGDLGQWILDTFKEQGAEKTAIAGFTGPTGKRKWFVEDVSPKDIPEYTAIQAFVSLSQPSDLMERINAWRTANPTGRNMITAITGYEKLIPDLVDDAQAEVEGLEEEAILEMETFKLLRGRRAVLRAAKKARASDDPEIQAEAEIFEQEAEVILQVLLGQGKEGEQKTPQARGIPDPAALSTEARTQNVSGAAQAARPAAPQRQG